MIRFLFLVLLAAPLGAHDFWLEPSTFAPAAGDRVRVAIRVGEGFRGEPVVRRASRIESFIVRDAHRERAVDGFEGRDPAGVVTIDGAGVSVIGYRGKPTPHEMETAKFNAYLEEEGITSVRATSGAVQREHFYRYAKSFLRSGREGGMPPALGYRVELQPLSDPFGPGPLRVLLTFDGKPLAGARVTAIERASRRTIHRRTDTAGNVTLDLGSGVWLLKSTHVGRASGAGREWDSFWASLTFER